MPDPPAGPGALVGNDDHLFDPMAHLVGQLTGRLTLSPLQVQRWVSLIETRAAWCRQRNMQYYLVVTPLKYVVYPDKAPPGFPVSADRPIQRLLAALPPELRSIVIYPADALREGRSEAETYFRTDMHWTDFGGYLVYLKICEAMRRDGALPNNLPKLALTRGTYRRVGDLGIRLTPERSEMAIRVRPAEEASLRHIYANFTYNVGQVEIFGGADPASLRGVIFRDSHGSFVLPFLAMHFRRLVAVAADNMFYDLLRSERPDVVITQVSEHALCEPDPQNTGDIRFPNDFPPVDFAAFSGLALPLVSNAAHQAGSSAIVDLDFTDRPEPVWTVGESTEMVLKCRIPYVACDLALTVSAFVHPPQLMAQRVELVVNGMSVGRFSLTGDVETIACRLPLECLFSGRTLRLELFHPDCASPRALGAGPEDREIGLELRRLTIHPAA